MPIKILALKKMPKIEYWETKKATFECLFFVRGRKRVSIIFVRILHNVNENTYV